MKYENYVKPELEEVELVLEGPSFLSRSDEQQGVGGYGDEFDPDKDEWD